MKIFVDTDSDILLVRRLHRDITERGRDIEGVIKQYHKFVKPAFEQNIEPAMRLADIVVPRGGGNMVAIDLIVQQQNQPLPQTLSVLQSSHQVRGLHTIIRYTGVCVGQTPQGEEYEGRWYQGRGVSLFFTSCVPPPSSYFLSSLPPPSSLQITGVSVLRAGETMEPALRAVCKDVRIGKILIQTNVDSGEPELHYLRLPKDISEDHVILMDSSVSTGAAAMMAVRVLLVALTFHHSGYVSLLMAEVGVHSVAYAFPQVRIITSAVDKSLDDFLHVLPGI
ncbi:hypothetical protein NQZ68_025054, partial [Dissostichus eleginoides]